MAVFALTSVTVTLNSEALASITKSATLALDAAQLDTTDMGSGGWVEMIGGLKSGTLQLELMDDAADDAVDEDLFGLLGTVVAFTIKPTSAAVGTGNAEYSGNVLVTSTQLGGGVGDLATKSLSFPTTGAVTRNVS